MPSNTLDDGIEGLMLARTLYRLISPKLRWSILVSKTVIAPFAVIARPARPFFRLSLSAIDAGKTTSVAQVSSKNATG